VTATNRRWLLSRRPTGIVSREDFEWTEEAVPAVADGEFLVRNLWLSCDPAQRAWMEIDTYIPVLPLGEVMAGGSAGEVVESKHPDFATGDLVSGVFGWQDYAVSDGQGFGGGLFPPAKIPPGVDIPTALSIFGVTGLTAYFGLLDVGQLKEGDTVLVSGAAGAVGSIVLQIAKLKGCRAVGVAGGARKCDWLREELGADDAIDYKGEDLFARVGEACPDGIDVFFDNVGGETLDAALAHLARGARVVICGAVSGYNEFEQRPGIRNHHMLIMQRGTMRGFLVFDFMDRVTEAIGDLASWVMEGKLSNQIDVVEGLENAPDALRRLFTGENLGKQLVKIADSASG
jgi:NADPH-dependent curcumin reductase CurA